jgi:hypothetical protein
MNKVADLRQVRDLPRIFWVKDQTVDFVMSQWCEF